MEKGSFERYAAVKISIKDILEWSYIYESEQNSNYLLTTNNQKIYRINIVAAIIHKEQVGSITSMLIEDGTGKIIIRWFEENESIKNTFIGNICCVVGKIRVYNNEKYISPEIFKKVDLLWLKVRSLELSAKDKNTILQKTNEFYEEKKEVKEQEEIVIRDTVLDTDLPFEKLTRLIKELDVGDGVLIEKIIEKSPLENTEKMLEKMLEKGDIFQNNPGKVKIL